MILFGHFGFRISQCDNKCFAVFVNFLFIFTYLMVWCAGLCIVYILYNMVGFKHIDSLFNYGFAALIVIMFTILLVKSYKKYNLVNLLKDIKDIRQHSTSKKNTICIAIVTCLLVAVVIFVNIFTLGYLFKNFGEQKLRISNIMQTSSPILLGFVTVVTNFMYPNTSWMLVTNLSFLLCVISIVLSVEFKNCVYNLKKSFLEENLLSTQLFYETANRYNELISIVHKVDEIFSGIVSVILVLSLGMLCGAVYAISNGADSTNWFNLMLYSVLNLAILLPPLANLNQKV